MLSATRASKQRALMRRTVRTSRHRQAAGGASVCKNREQLWRLKAAEPFDCELDPEGYADLSRDLRRTTLNIDTGVEDYYQRVET